MGQKKALNTEGKACIRGEGSYANRTGRESLRREDESGRVWKGNEGSREYISVMGGRGIKD